jgi:hypothetical protein
MKTAEAIKLVVAAAAVGLCVIAILFFALYRGSIIPVPWFWLGLAVLIVFVLMNKMTSEAAREDTTSERAIAQLKQTGRKIKVEYDQCTIHDGSYTREGQIAGMNVLSGDEMSNVQQEAVRNTIFTFHHRDPETNEVHDYRSPLLNMDGDYLAMLFLAREVYLYVSREDPNLYWFDLGEAQNIGP